MIKRLLNKYWSGNSSNLDKKSLLGYLNENTFLENELKTDDSISLSQETSKATLKKIHTAINKEKSVKGKIFSINSFLKASAAAIIILVSVIGIREFNKPNELNLAVNDLTTINNNYKGQAMSINMPDNSTVILYTGSKISYHKDYNKKNRTIYLSGKAKFSVTKNKEIPFIVNTHSFSTTALGTVFIVDENFAKNKSNVELLEGKVVVQPLEKHANTFAPVYLLPNQNITIDTVNFKTIVKNTSKTEKINQIKHTKEEVLTLETKKDIEVVKTKTSSVPEVMVFDKTPLSEVFKKLSVLYGVDINYINSTSKELTFTGELNGEIDIYEHLKIICQLNELKLIQQQKQFIISK